MRKTLLAVIAACLTVAARADSPWANVADPVFQRIDQKALPHPAVYAVTQDDAGFIWVGTPGGLARYDGYQFRNFLPGRDDRNVPTGVQALAADRSGRLWIGTPSTGLACLDESTNTFRAWHADPIGGNGPRSASIIALALASDSTLWVGGDSGLDRFDPRSGTFQHVDLVSNERQPRIEAILIDHAQTVWVATIRGLYFQSRTDKGFHPFSADLRSFFSLHEDSSHNLWAGTQNEVLMLGADRHITRTYPVPGEQWGIMEVTPGIFWVATYDGGISIIDTMTQRTRRMVIDRANPSGLTPGDVWQFFRDRSGLIWVANGPGGLLVHNPINRGIFELASVDKHVGEGDMGARTIAAAPDGALFLGGSDKVVRIDPQIGSSTELIVPDHRKVQTLHSAPDGTLWIGTTQGICKLSPRQPSIDCPAGFHQDVGRVFGIVTTGTTLWAGTGAGVFAFDEQSGVATRYRHDDSPNSLSNDFITALYADRRGHIWAGTSNGINRIDAQTGRVVQFVHDPKNSNSLSTGPISSIVEDRIGRMWISTVGGPLNVLTEHGDTFAIRRLGSAEGAPENVAALALGVDGSIWASATNSVSRIDANDLHTHSFGSAEGVQETEFWTRAVSTAQDGTIFFAGTSAITVIAPAASASWTYASPVAITALKAGERTLQVWGNPIELSASARDINVEFAALDYSGSSALRYAYKLDGYNRDWISADSSHRFATYTHLSPGTYTLRIRATNRLGAWSPNEIVLHLNALPAWYETSWFRLFLVLLLLLAIVGVIRARTRILRLRAERLEQIVAERTSELATANAALENMTITDPLTGLRNRRFFMQRIDDDVALALRQETDLVFFLVDIDHFKAVNDELGHAAGDRVLQQMRERLEQVFRSSDYVLRWGGEEFLAVTRGSSRNDAAEIAERLRLSIAERPFILDGGQTLPKTASIGYAAFPFVSSAPRTISWTGVVELADQALYLAKNGGRNTWVGLMATAHTDAESLSEQLASSPENAIAANAVEVVRPAGVLPP